MQLLPVLLASLFTTTEVTSPPGQPDVNGWAVIPWQLDTRPGDYLKGLVGQVMIYQNPGDVNEFVKVYYRHIALVSERPNENSRTKESGRATLVGNSGFSFHKREEQDAIQRVQKATDVIAYVRWRVVRDARIDKDVLDGNVESWLLSADGVWTYDVSPKLGAIKETPLSEPSKYDSKSSVIVGVRYALGNTTHIVRVDQNNLKAPKADKRVKTVAKKEKSNEK